MVSICILGTGGIARYHMEAFQKNQNAIIEAVCDINEERVNQFADEFGIKKRYTSYSEMLQNEKNADIIDVCVWNRDHASKTIEALNSGFNVICEKPMALNAAEAEEMVKTAEKNNKLLMIGFVLRFAPETIVAKKMIESGKLGEIQYAKGKYMRRSAPGGWFLNKSMSGGGPVIDIGIHALDRCRYLMGNPKPVSVYAVAYSNSLNKDINSKDYCDVEDFATAIIRYDNGSSTLLETSYRFQGKGGSSCGIYGSDGGIEIDDRVTLYNQIDGVMMQSEINGECFNEYKPFFEAELDHFVKCVSDNIPCISTGYDGLEIMRIIDAIYKSAETGEEVKL